MRNPTFDHQEPLLHLYRARVLAYHGVPAAAPPRAHQILLVHKQGKRGIANFKRVQAHLQRRFGGVARVATTTYAPYPPTPAPAAAAA